MLSSKEILFRLEEGKCNIGSCHVSLTLQARVVDAKDILNNKSNNIKYCIGSCILKLFLEPYMFNSYP